MTDSTPSPRHAAVPVAPPRPEMQAPTSGSAQSAFPVTHHSGQSVFAAQPQLGQKRDPWAVWILCFVTLGIYYYIWYFKINEELRRFAPQAVQVKPALAVLAQFVPVVNFVSLAKTAGRVNAAHASVNSAVRVSAATTILAGFWFLSQPRYLQRRLNTLWDTTGALYGQRSA